MGPTRVITADLTCGGKITTVQFFDESIKTPRTSFYSTPHPAEAELYNLLRTRLGLPAPIKGIGREGMSPLTQAERMLSWHDSEACVMAKVTAFKHKNGSSLPHEQKTIVDIAVLRQITDLLDRLPTEGEIMVKWDIDVPILKLELTCGNEASIIEFYSGRIKTPATSFYAQPHSAETQLFKLLTQQLASGPFAKLKEWLSQ